MPTRPAAAAVLTVFLSAASAVGQAPVRLVETFTPGGTVSAELKVALAGRMTLPPEPGKPAKSLVVQGSSLLQYDESPLPEDEQSARSVRLYREVGFERTVGDQKQTATVRPAVRRMVVLRSEKGKAPFSPDGPMTWGELDLVRTDLFAPALVPGLLPKNAVTPGETWQASAAAVRELTDMAKVDAGGLTVTFVAVVKPAAKELAKLTLSGTVQGVDEFGPGRHAIEGTAYFDLAAGVLTYLSLNAAHELLDGGGRVAGKIDGRMVWTRTPLNSPPALLAADTLKTLTLTPTAENSRLLYDNPELGVEFVYPRRWRVGAVQGRQVTLDGPNGAGLLLTLEPPATVPTATAFRTETADFLKKQGAKLGPPTDPKETAPPPAKLERFGFDADLNGEALRMEYAVATRAEGGATAAARLPRADAAALTADLDSIVAKLVVRKPVPGK